MVRLAAFGPGRGQNAEHSGGEAHETRITGSVCVARFRPARDRPALPQPHRERDRALSGGRLGRRGGAALVQKLNESMGQNFIVENRAGGAGGAVGANTVAKAAPDGYTLMLTASIHVITPFLNSKIPYDAVKDFAPVSLVASGPLLVSTAPNVPASNAEGILRSRAQGAGQIHLRDIELRLGRASRGRAAQARCRRRHAGHRLQGRGRRC